MTEKDSASPEHVVVKKWFPVVRIVAATLLTVGSVVLAISMKLMSGTFVTHESLNEVRAGIMREVEQQRQNDHAVAVEKDAKNAAQIEGLNRTLDDVKKSLDRIYNLLLSRPR